jgi:hypothetical protein
LHHPINDQLFKSSLKAKSKKNVFLCESNFAAASFRSCLADLEKTFYAVIFFASLCAALVRRTVEANEEKKNECTTAKQHY